ncbi:AI-2E family transporter (plasmid) [Rhizobium sp. TH2]|uniref:AI-2E family transporter n=1 Tax=Rhizobium sp. TH2 TaxID=2775403 RepID=UPI0021583988|nr:AI-2E family transporter [Rhizobium sp. TH2]UVC12375.1 AI-2E family transporter [Rhizobium sp. TH2]
MPNDESRKPSDLPFQVSRKSHPYIVGIFLMLAVYGLYIGRDFLTPVFLAFILATTLTPVVRYMGKWGMRPAVAATILIIFSAGSFGALSYATSGPISQMISDAPEIGAKLRDRMETVRRMFDKAIQATAQIDAVSENVSGESTQKVVVAQPGILSRAAGNLLSVGTTLAVTFVLSLFLLASGTMFYQKILQLFPNLSDKKRALKIIYDIQTEISRYLFTITIINIIVGIVVGVGVWALGIPNPLVWAVASAVLNFLPYIGALIAIVLVGSISIATFDNTAYGLIAPAFILFVHILEGQFLTPMLLGRRLELNAVFVFISISFWSWLWGFIGALMAVPILVILKVACDNFEALRPIGIFLTADRPPEEPPSENDDGGR